MAYYSTVRRVSEWEKGRNVTCTVKYYASPRYGPIAHCVSRNRVLNVHFGITTLYQTSCFTAMLALIRHAIIYWQLAVQLLSK